MVFDLERLEHLQGEGLVRSQCHPEADLRIFNYTERCQYGRNWTSETLACRGLILDGAGEVVARPFGKFFNLGEPAAPKLPKDEPYVVTEKMDGSLGIAYELGGEWFIASRGSFTSEQAIIGTEMLREGHFDAPGAATPLFEIVYPSNRIVVDYGDRRELVLLASIDKETGRDRDLLPVWNGAHVKTIESSLHPRDLIKHPIPNAEGFVVCYPRIGLRVKIKFEEYVRLHRIVSGLSEHRIWEALRAGDDLRALAGIPDEAYAFIEVTSERILREVADLRSTAERVVNAAPLTKPRKDLAAYFFASDANPNLCFSLWDQKDIEHQLWKIIEPKAVASV